MIAACSSCSITASSRNNMAACSSRACPITKGLPTCAWWKNFSDRHDETRLSLKELHSRYPRCLSIECDRKLAVGGMGAALDQVIREVGAAGSERPKRLRDDIRAFNSQFLAAQQALQDLLDFLLLITAGDAQYPN